MSRSRRRTPIFAFTTSVSEADDKAMWHRCHRQAERIALQKAGADYIPRSHQAHSSTWRMAKDGKRWRDDATPRDMRK